MIQYVYHANMAIFTYSGTVDLEEASAQKLEGYILFGQKIENNFSTARERKIYSFKLANDLSSVFHCTSLVGSLPASYALMKS